MTLLLNTHKTLDLSHPINTHNISYPHLLYMKKKSELYMYMGMAPTHAMTERNIEHTCFTYMCQRNMHLTKKTPSSY